MSTERAAIIAVKVLLFGLLILGFGIWAYSSSDSNPYDVSCGSEQMKPGDTCVSYGRGGGGSETYEERVAGQISSNDWERTYGPLVASFGGLLIAGSLFTLILAKSPSSHSEHKE